MDSKQAIETLESEKQALTTSNSQIMNDYKADLEALKSAMRAKDTNDKHALENILKDKKLIEVKL